MTELYWGATYTQVTEALQGADTANTLEPERFGGQSKIEEKMAAAKEEILAVLPINSFNVLTKGRVEGHKVIDNVQNLSQTAVDPGQEFPGTVDADTFRLARYEIADQDQGIDASEYDLSLIHISEPTRPY